MEGGDLRRALWQNQEEYAWDRRGAQVLLTPVEVALYPAQVLYIDLSMMVSTDVERMCHLQVALDVARGLHFLHSSGVIHRCSKPHLWMSASCHTSWSCVVALVTLLLAC